MKNKKAILISSVLAAMLLVSVVGVTESNAYACKNNKKINKVKVQKVKDVEVSLKEVADEKGSVTLPDGSTSKDIVIKENTKKVEIKRKENVTDKEKKERMDKVFMEPAGDIEEIESEVVNKEEAALYPIRKKNETSPREQIQQEQTQQGYTEYLTDSEGNPVTMTEFLNKEAAEYGSVILEGGASSRDVVLKRDINE